MGVLLGLERNRVIGLRMAKLMRGGKAARRQAQRRVSEKVLCGSEGRHNPDGRRFQRRVSSNIEKRWRQTPNGSAENEHSAIESRRHFG